jgi:hypothetical protein
MTESFLVITSKLGPYAEHLIRPNVNWFNEDKNRAEELADMLLPDRQGTSLRLADHLVVQYSRENVIMIRSDDSQVPSELWLDYRRVLACTGKKFFDVFKRKHSISARLLGVDIQTTVGQIVFLCWYQKRGLTQYMSQNEERVRTHMQAQETASKTLRNPKDVSCNKKKARAPSRAEAVKPVSRVYKGSFKMDYT